jgi:hypothetical protein
VADEETAAASARRRVTRQAGSVAREVAGTATATVAGVASVLPAPVTHLARTSGRLVADLPRLETEVDVVVDEISAQRLAIKALTAELTALDEQLAVLESTLAPLRAWTHQWTRARSRLVDALERLDDWAAGQSPAPPPDDDPDDDVTDA